MMDISEKNLDNHFFLLHRYVFITLAISVNPDQLALITHVIKVISIK